MPEQVWSAVWEALATQRGLWGWGDADSLVPWTDDQGREVVPAVVGRPAR